MHILALVGAVIGAAAFWYWRYRQAREFGVEILDAVGRIRGAYSRANFRKKAEGSVLNNIDDPALAAAIFLFSLAEEARTANHRAEEEIVRQIGGIVPAGKMDEIIAHARWAARAVIDPRDCVRRFSTLWRDSLVTHERDDLIAMAEAVRCMTPGSIPAQIRAIEALKTAMNPESGRR